jgi:predicted dehydrogenase
MNLALVGLGYWGPNLLRTFNNLGVLRVAYDLDPAKVEKFEKDPVYRNIVFDTDWERCLQGDSIDGVIIATPPNTHHAIAMKALNAGKHVFIEKPMTLDVDQAEEIVALAGEKGLVILVGHIFLYSPEILKLKELVKSDDFGDIQYVYTKRLNLGKIQSPANVVEDLAPHDISILNFLLDADCTEVQVTAKAHVLETEDVAFINMKYGDVLCNLHLSWLDPLKVRDTVVVGTKQMVVCDSMNKRIRLYNKGVELEEVEKGMETYAGHLLSYRYGDEYIPYIPTTEPMKLECEDFIKTIQDVFHKPAADGQIGLSVVKVLRGLQSSLSAGGVWVAL